MDQASGIAGFLAQTGGLGRAIAFLLLAMSVATWYLVVAKAVQVLAAHRRSARFLDTFRSPTSLAAAQNPQPELHLRADRTVAYQAVAEVMAAAARAGLTRIGFVTHPDDKVN